MPQLDSANKDELLKMLSAEKDLIDNDPQPKSNAIYKNNFLQKIRNKRKQYDNAYIRSILSTNLEENTDALNQIKNFINSIKVEDPNYYDNIVLTILKNFRDIAKSQTEIHTNQYEVTPELLGYVENARKCINIILDDYKIEHIKQKEKPYALRYIDRCLFNGSLNKINPPAPPSTFKTMSASAEESIAILRENQKEGHCYHDSNNAEILITSLECYMQEKGLKDEPFPVLINSFINEKNPKSNTMYFYQKNHKNEYSTNPMLVAYYCHALEKNYPHKWPLHLRQGIKHQKNQKVYEQDNLIENICLNAKQVLVNLCKDNNISPDIIHIAFGSYLFGTPKQDETEGYKQIYRWLTEYKMKDREGHEKNHNNESYGTIFVTSRHHDREQINFSTSANTAENNMILTLPINPKASVKLILNNIINRIKSKFEIKEPVDQELLDALERERAKLKTLQTTEKRVDVHKDILHGANIELVEQNSEDINYYYLTPKKPEEKGKPKSKSAKGKTKNQKQDEHIIAIIDARTPIYDKSGNEPPKIIDKLAITTNYYAALNNIKGK